MKLTLHFILMLSIYCKNLSSKTIETTPVRFILDYVDTWEIKYPKIFLPEGAKYSTNLWSLLSSRYIQAIVRSGFVDSTEFLEVLKKDMAKMEVFVSGNYSTVRFYLENIMSTNFPNYHSSFVLICYDCTNDTDFHLNNSHDILCDITLAIQSQVLGKEYFYLYALTYDYRRNCIEKVHLGHWCFADGFLMTTKVMPNDFRNFKYHAAILKVMTVKAYIVVWNHYNH